MTITNASRFPSRVALAAIPVVGLAAFVLIVDGAGGLRSTGAAVLILAPVFLYVALEWPLQSVFGLYALLVPFDNLLGTGSFGTITKFLGIAAGGFLALSLLRQRGFTFESVPLRVLCLLALWMTASALWALDQSAALRILPTYLGLFALYAVFSMVPATPAQFRALLVTILVGGLCAAAYGAHTFYQTALPWSGAVPRLVLQMGEYNVDPNHFADALIFPASIAGMWALKARSFFVRVACIGAVGLLAASIMMSGSREGLLATILIAAYYAWRSRYRVRLLVIAAGVAVAAASVESSVFERFSNALQTGGSGRTSIWAVALEAAKHRLLQGYGIGNFPVAFDQFYLHVPQPYPFGWDSPAHNIVLHYLVETGLIGLFAVGAFFWAQFRSMRHVDSQSELYDERIMMEAALLAIVFVSTAIDLFHYKYAWLVFCMVALLRNAARGPQPSPSMARTTPVMMAARSAPASTRAFASLPSSRSASLSSSES
ncbi:MAG TPA: O-antigen ligase family protein [Candidatus Baltobacteraceae bacterium]|nr:O-antigen ligase family protein [Candidatus Baltobacteraceae bacterium]